MADALDIVTRECFRSFAALPNGELIDERGAFGVATDIPLTFFNGITEAPAEAMPWVIDVYRRRGQSFRWWLRDRTRAEELLGYGMRYVWDSTGMIAPLATMRFDAPPPELEIVRVRDERAFADWTYVLTTVFERPAADRDKWVAGFGPLGFDGPWAHFVGYVDGVALATTSVFVAGEVAGIYHVGTMKEARGRGIGSAVTRAALQYARDCGATEAALQSSEMAVGVYRGLGFAECGTLSMYAWMG